MSLGVEIKDGDSVLVRNAEGEWSPAIAASGVEGVYGLGPPYGKGIVHDFPIIWIRCSSEPGRTPWPAEDVKRAGGDAL